MNWQDIIKNTELVYASAQDDTGFRTWSLKKTTYNISFYEEHNIEAIDKIVCSIIKSNSGSIEQKRFATILGFNVIDNFQEEPKRYADSAEQEIFNSLIQPVIDWGLIDKYDECYTLTEIGEKALIEEKKYEFYTGEKILFENPNLNSSDSFENLFFPFNYGLGVYSEITNKKKIEYKKININEIFPVEETDLIKQHKQQSNEEYYIYQSQESPYFKFDSCQVDIRLFKQDGVYIPIIFHNDNVSIKASELLNKPENTTQKEKKIEWALYLKLIKDPNAKLDYKTIIPFEDLLELDSLILDKRLVWNDKKLFTYLAQNANADQWYSISNKCPIEILKLHFNKYSSELDWTILSSRIDDDFLIKNATHYPWNFETISAKENISIEVIKKLLLIPELKEVEWDWDVIMPQLDFQFIKSNIVKVNFELGELTKNIFDAQPLISKFPSKKWDWNFISNEYDLSFILENILKFSEHLNLIQTLNRAFTSSEYVEPYCNSASLKEVLTNHKEDKLIGYSPNQLRYVWSESLIDLLESIGYLTWDSGNYTLGFECNPYFEWTYNLFGKYNKKVSTDKGFAFMSSNITDTRLISDYKQFNWNWDLISLNTNLINDSTFVLEFKDRLDFNLLLPTINGETLELIFEEANVLNFLVEHPDKWIDITEKPSKEFILKNIDLNWDWKILTKRFCSTINIESLGNANWIDKWDWVYLTKNLDFNIVLDELDLYVDRWDWDYLSQETDKQFILNNLPEYNEYWNWEFLLNERFEKVDFEFDKLIEIATCISVFDTETNTSLWKIITEKFDLEDLESLIMKTNNIEVFNWNYSFFYDLSGFSPLNYLDQNCDYISWEAFSSSKSLNKSFKWDKNTFSYGIWINWILTYLETENFNWDFKSLSKLDSINWNSSILHVQTASWDWEYLSEYSSCFRKGKGFEERFNEFIDFIDFQTFSKRKDSDITEELLNDFIDKDWNWKALSSNDSVKFTMDFISKHHDKNWDWECLSSRNDIELNNEMFLELSDKAWNWQEISKRIDIDFSEELIKNLSNKPLDWAMVSKSESFVPNANVLSLLKGKELDWYSISDNPNLSLEVLWDYREQLDWELVTQNKAIDFSNISILKKFQNSLDWNYISSSEDFSISIVNLKQFKNNLEWATICDRKDFIISEELLQPFADVLNWSKVSMSMDIRFTSDLIEKFRDNWDWQELKKNPQVIEKFDSTLKNYQTEFNCVDFLERFDRQPFIFHFTHLFNAIDIIKKRKILSRNRAEGNFANAAGNLVDRRSTAHDYARFYFRPHTPTQFYNECLGWDDTLKTSWGKSYYQQARNLGLPKCPIPVFFKFDLKEVLMKMPNKCFYSTGNMQTNWSQVKNVSNDPDSLNVTHLYANADDFENYKQYAQQEFLIEDEFDFSTLDSFEIICYNEEYENILKNQLGDDPICKKINSDEWKVYHGGNRELLISQTDSEISIESDYENSAHILIKGEGISEMEILESEHIQKETKTEIIAYPKIRFVKTKKPLEVYFVDTSIGKRDWLIYKN